MLDNRPVTRLNFGLDYDDTFTQDPGLWRAFIALCQERGHSVFVTTARFSNNVKDIQENLPELELIPSDGRPKRAATEEAGVSIDIWIDDMPHIIME